MDTDYSTFISARSERIILSVLSASGCAFKAVAFVDVLRALGKTDLDNTDVARDHSFRCIANTESCGARRINYSGVVKGFNITVELLPHLVLQVTSWFRKPFVDK